MKKEESAIFSQCSPQSHSVGERLQWLRNRHGLSQRELARRADVTNSTLSMIEQGKVSPSIGSLEKILNAFPVSLQEFFALPKERAKTVIHQSELTRVLRDETEYTLLPLQGMGSGKATLMKHKIPPGGKSTFDWLKLQGEISGFVLSGELALSIDGVIYQVRAGDAFCCSLECDYYFENTGFDNCFLVSVIATDVGAC